MGRGPVVAKRRDAVNAVKGKVFSIHAKLISMAAQKGGDPDGNPSLAAAIYKAKKDGVPNDNIDRSIKKGTGEDKSLSQIVEIIYEGYSSGGVSVMVSVLTDNKNRTVSNIRHIFSKCGGNMGESGSVSWMFHRKGIIFIDPKKYNFDKIEEIVYETEAEDIILEKNYIKIVTDTASWHNIEKILDDKSIDIVQSKLDYIPENEIEITEFDKALKFKKMMESFLEDEDVNLVSTNEIISDKLEKKVDDFIEKNTFRT